MDDEDPIVPSPPVINDPSKANSEKEPKDAKKKSPKEKSPQKISTDFYEDADVITSPPAPPAVFTPEQGGASDASQAEDALWHQGKTTTRWRWQRVNRVRFRSAR